MNNYKQDRKYGKFLSIRQRKNLLAMWDDFYNGLQLPYVRDKIRKTYINLSNRQLLLDRLAYKNLTKSIIDKLSILFQSGYTVYIDGNLLKTTLLRNKLQKYGFNKMLSTLNKYTNNLFDMHVTCRYDLLNQRVVFDLIKPQTTFVLQRCNYPTLAELIAYIVDLDMDTANGKAVNTVNVWTKLWNYIGLIKLDGTIIPTGLLIPNKFGYIPVIHFTNDYRINTYFSDASQPLVQRNLDLDMKWTLFLTALSLQSLSTLVISGMIDGKTLPMGIQHVLYLELQNNIGQGDSIISDAKYINPDAPLKLLNLIIKDILIQTAIEYGISADAYKANNTATSGYEVKLSKTDLINATNLDIPIYQPSLKLLVQTMMRLLNMYGTVNTWSELLIQNLNFTINKVSFLNDLTTLLSILLKLINLGINSAINYLMLKYLIDRLTATNKYKQLLLDNNLKLITTV